LRGGGGGDLGTTIGKDAYSGNLKGGGGINGGGQESQLANSKSRKKKKIVSEKPRSFWRKGPPLAPKASQEGGGGEMVENGRGKGDIGSKEKKRRKRCLTEHQSNKRPGGQSA